MHQVPQDHSEPFFLSGEARSTRYPLSLANNPLGVLGVSWRLGGNLDVWGVLVEAVRVSGSRNQSEKPNYHCEHHYEY